MQLATGVGKGVALGAFRARPPIVSTFDGTDPSALSLLHSLSDVVIAIAFVAISVRVLLLVRKGQGEVPYRSAFFILSLFLAACAASCIADVWILWRPDHWLLVAVKVGMAFASIAAMLAMPRLLPSLLLTLRSAQVSEQRRSELESAHRDLQSLFERLKDSERARSEVFANVSHELRTPLSLILGPAQAMLEDQALSSERRRALRTVVRNARLLEKHVSDLLLVAKGEAGSEAELHANYVDCDFAELVRRTADNFEAVAVQRNIGFILDLPSKLRIEMDRDAMERVVINLLSNAFKFTPEGGSIRCTLAQSDDQHCTFSVSDSGPGVPVDLREVIFERFRQADSSSTREYGGFGLGLAIVHSFVEMHRGTVRVDQAPEGGAWFRVELPTFAPAGVTVARPRAFVPIDEELVTADLKVDFEEITASAGTIREKAKILVVEDNRDMNRFITSVLEPEYRTISAFDGRSGLQRAARANPDLIVTDVMMPGLSGEDLVRRVRALDSLAGTPILVLSARDDADLRTDILKQGAQDYLTKPFVAEELRARVRNLVTAKRARDLLSQEVSTQRLDLEALAQSVANHQRDLETALEQTQMARTMAEQASAMKSNLLRMMSHELRTPVTAVELQLTLFERNMKLTDDQLAAMARVRRSMQRLLDLIETALEYARIESGRFEIRRSQFSLFDLMQEVAAEFLPHAELKNIRLVATSEGPLPLLDSDRRLLRLIAVNLVGNAVKFTQRGEVGVRVRYDGEQHLVIVSDSGPSIPPDLHDEVFEPFKQVGDIRRREGAGSGLGLALVKDMVGALGGNIRLDSPGSGSGSIFTVRVPSAEKAVHQPGRAAALQ